MYLNKYNMEICSQQRARYRVAILFNTATVMTRQNKLIEYQYKLHRDPD